MFNLDQVKEYSRLELIRVLDTIQGRKGLVIDTQLTSLLSLVAGFNMLKDRGVDKVYTIDQTNVNIQGPLIIILKPTIENIELLTVMVKRVLKIGSSNSLSVFFVPKRTLVCDVLLKESGIYGDISIGEYHLDIYPYEHNVLSLNSPQSFKDLFLNGDISIIKSLANSVMKLQLLYGFIPTILGVGDLSLDLFNSLERIRLEYLSTNQMGNECEFDSMIIIDRSIDIATALKTQLTYEGMVDEMYNIQSCFLQLENSNSQGSSSSNVKPKKILLNNTDFVFGKIRDASFEVVGQILKMIAVDMKDEEDTRLTMTTSLQLKEFASKLGTIQAKRFSLETRNLQLNV